MPRFLIPTSFTIAILLSLPRALTAQPARTPEPEYPVPYRVPTPDDVRGALEAIRAHVESETRDRVVDRTTGATITDFSTLNENATVPGGKFPPLAYPTGVLHAGMLLAAEVTGDARFSAYAAQRFQFFADHYAYFEKLAAAKGSTQSNPFRNLLEPSSLDSCGAMGAAMIKARRAGIGPDLKIVIDRWADYVRHKQFRLPDGTLARHSPHDPSLWGDDLYMSVPLLAQYAKLTGDADFFDDAVRQVTQISARLFIERKGIFAHGFIVANADHNLQFHWGRANGWCMMAMCELLDLLPENHAGRERVLALLRAHMQGVAQLQSASGLWHQLLDREDSYLETSASAMFVFSMARAVNRGWVGPESFAPVALVGWCGLASKISADGHIDGICIGTNIAQDAMYYYARPAIDDAHGYGPVLLAGAEVLRLLTNPKFEASIQGRVLTVRPAR